MCRVTEGSLEVGLVLGVFEVDILVGLLSLLLILVLVLLLGLLLVVLLVLCTLSLLLGGFALLQTLFLGGDHICMMSVAKPGA